jgi:hypothetical protein
LSIFHFYISYLGNTNQNLLIVPQCSFGAGQPVAPGKHGQVKHGMRCQASDLAILQERAERCIPRQDLPHQGDAPGEREQDFKEVKGPSGALQADQRPGEENHQAEYQVGDRLDPLEDQRQAGKQKAQLVGAHQAQEKQEQDVHISLKSHSKTEHGAHSRGKSTGRIIVHQVFGMDRIARSFLCDSPTS